MTSEKRFFRSDLALGLVDSATETFSATLGDEDADYQIGIRAYRCKGLGRFEFTPGVPVAVADVVAGPTAHVTVTSSWNMGSSYSLALHWIEVKVYGKITDGAWTLLGTWATEVLVDTQLDDATWSLSYHVSRVKILTKYNYRFAYGESNSWINNFCHSTPSTSTMTVQVM